MNRPLARLLGVLGVVVLVGFILPSFSRLPRLGWLPDTPASTVKGPLGPDYPQKHHLTSVLAHAPGFTVFENLYWRNGTYYIVTDQPWALPATKVMFTGGARDDEHGKPGNVEILSVRMDAISKHVDERNQLGTTISPAAAVVFTEAAEDLPSPMRKRLLGPKGIDANGQLIAHDDHFIDHYYHWIGELFLGAWRIWNHWALRTGIKPPSFETIAFSRLLSPEELAKTDLHHSWGWADHAGANEYFMKAFFPDATIESATTWDARAATEQLYRIEKVVVADRFAGHAGPSAGWKPWGDVLRVPVDPNWLADLRDVLLKSYRGKIDMRPKSVPRVSYLTRQDTSRRLTDVAHQNLIHSLERLQDEGLCELTVLHFTDATPFEDQIAQMAATDVLIGVHGNGLTHTLWMSPGPGKAVFEIMAKVCSMNDYGPLATAAGVRHWQVFEDKGTCEVYECPDRGCDKTIDDKGPNRDDLVVDPKLITDKIRMLYEQNYKN